MYSRLVGLHRDYIAIKAKKRKLPILIKHDLDKRKIFFFVIFHTRWSSFLRLEETEEKQSHPILIRVWGTILLMTKNKPDSYTIWPSLGYIVLAPRVAKIVISQKYLRYLSLSG